MRRLSSFGDRGYVRVETAVLMRKMGEIVDGFRKKTLRELMNYDFTAQMEDSLIRLQITVPRKAARQLLQRRNLLADKAEKDPYSDAS